LVSSQRILNHFDILILEEAFNFLQKIDKRHAEKILYNIRKAQKLKDPKLFKKLNAEIWEFRTLVDRNQYRLLAFWDKSSMNTKVVVTTGVLKKSSKLPEREINKAVSMRSEYLNQKK
jgi:phage-related protein